MDRSKWLFLPEGIVLLTVGVVVTLASYFIFDWPFAIIPLLFVLFTLYFFRNPEREINASELEVLSPADGRVLSIEEVYEDRYMNMQSIKVSIFLSVFNVHVNRSPIQGIVEYIHYQPGQFLPAFKGHASEINERNYVGIKNSENPARKVLVVQITGFIARRIVCWVKTGRVLAQGERFGMIKFGSCTVVYLPVGSEILVSEGQTVRGGTTVIGRMTDG